MCQGKMGRKEVVRGGTCSLLNSHKPKGRPGVCLNARLSSITSSSDTHSALLEESLRALPSCVVFKA
jgi:hypothetical protein